jgi:CDP-6-deoxy-D-xylo-4-hexulose-3-dehydrase
VLIQQEIGASSWFGFSLVIRPGVSLTRDELLIKLNALGFEVRPIVAGNFAKNEVIKYFNSEVSGELVNADHLDAHGLFIGSHHHSFEDAVMQLSIL